MIKKISFSKLNHDELQTFCSKTIQTVESVTEINTGVVATILSELKVSYNEYSTLVKPERKKGFKDLLKEKHLLRIDAFRALQDVVLGFSQRLQEVHRTSARFLLEIFTRRGWTIYEDVDPDESLEINQLIKELDGNEAMNSITLLQLMDMVNDLKTSHLDFEDTFNNKASNSSKQKFIAMVRIRPVLIKQLSDLLERINSDVKYAENSAEYSLLINKLNDIISATAKALKARITLNDVGE